MRIIFSILSAAYIAGIFLLAGSPVVSTLSEFNPYSILHIPLYGILTVLLIFSFLPREMGSLFQRGQLPNNLMTHRSGRLPIYAFTHRQLFIVGLIALVVGIADEIHQAYVPGRDASVTDVLLDLFGIILALLFIPWLLKTKIHK